MRPFLDYGSQSPSLFALLQTEVMSSDSKKFVEDILQALGRANKLEDLMSEPDLKSLALAASITDREQEVLQLVSDGSSNREIALKMCISPGTVKTHLANIYGKLNVNNRVQAVAEAQELQLI